MTDYDDHDYCDKDDCRRHLPDCWCFISQAPTPDEARWLCPGGPGHGL